MILRGMIADGLEDCCTISEVESIDKEISNFCKVMGYQFISDYSGKFMYDRECIGIICDDITKTLSELYNYLIIDKGFKEVPMYKIDVIDICYNSTLETIIYFPLITCKEGGYSGRE